MPAQPVTPDTTAYMVLGYAVCLVLLGALVAYLVLKARSLRAQVEMLQSLEEEERREQMGREAAPASPVTTPASAGARQPNAT